MLSEQELRERIKSFLESNESLDSLEDWLTVEVFASIKKDSAPELKALVARALHSIDLRSDGHIDEVSFKNELRELAFPNEIQEREFQIAFDDLPPIGNAPKPDVRPSVNSSVQLQWASFAS